MGGSSAFEGQLDPPEPLSWSRSLLRDSEALIGEIWGCHRESEVIREVWIGSEEIALLGVLDFLCLKEVVCFVYLVNILSKYLWFYCMFRRKCQVHTVEPFLKYQRVQNGKHMNDNNDNVNHKNGNSDN